MNGSQKRCIINNWTESFEVVSAPPTYDFRRWTHHGVIKWDDFTSKTGGHQKKSTVIDKSYDIVSAVVYDLIVEMIEDKWNEQT